MTWPKIAAKYPSKKKCPVCGAGPYKAGEIIYKINEEYWCCNENCGETPPVRSFSDLPDANSVPISLVQYHNDAWEIAYEKSKSFYQYDKNTTQKDIMILAQVFYKGLMGVKS